MLLQLGVEEIRKLQIKLCSSGVYCYGIPREQRAGIWKLLAPPLSLNTKAAANWDRSTEYDCSYHWCSCLLISRKTGNWYWTWSRKTPCLSPFRSHLSDLIGENLCPESWFQGSPRGVVFSSGRHTKSELKLKLYLWQILLVLSIFIGASLKGDVRLVYKKNKKILGTGFS